jgi:hypothetical protein
MSLGVHVSGDSGDGLDKRVVDDVAKSGEVTEVGAERGIGVGRWKKAEEAIELGLD